MAIVRWHVVMIRFSWQHKTDAQAVVSCYDKTIQLWHPRAFIYLYFHTRTFHTFPPSTTT
jgi:hypothetical protein